MLHLTVFCHHDFLRLQCSVPLYAAGAAIVAGRGCLRAPFAPQCMFVFVFSAAQHLFLLRQNLAQPSCVCVQHKLRQPGPFGAGMCCGFCENWVLWEFWGFWKFSVFLCCFFLSVLLDFLLRFSSVGAGHKGASGAHFSSPTRRAVGVEVGAKSWWWKNFGTSATSTTTTVVTTTTAVVTTRWRTTAWAEFEFWEFQ